MFWYAYLQVHVLSIFACKGMFVSMRAQRGLKGAYSQESSTVNALISTISSQSCILQSPTIFLAGSSQSMTTCGGRICPKYHDMLPVVASNKSQMIKMLRLFSCVSDTTSYQTGLGLLTSCFERRSHGPSSHSKACWTWQRFIRCHKAHHLLQWDLKSSFSIEDPMHHSFKDVLSFTRLNHLKSLESQKFCQEVTIWSRVVFV